MDEQLVKEIADSMHRNYFEQLEKGIQNAKQFREDMDWLFKMKVFSDEFVEAWENEEAREMMHNAEAFMDFIRNYLRQHSELGIDPEHLTEAILTEKDFRVSKLMKQLYRH
jgi:DNA polymerase III delta prime subunit